MQRVASRWVDVKSAADGHGVPAGTMFRWVAAHWVIARRLPGKRGRVRVLQGPDGAAVDVDTPEAPSPLRPRRRPRWVSVDEAAAAAGVKVRAVRGWVKRREVVHRRRAGGHSRRLEVALDWDGLPADARDPHEAARIAAEADATAAEARAAAEREELRRAGVIQGRAAVA